MTTAEERFIESILSDDENYPIYGRLPQVKIDVIKGEAERKAMLRAILAFSKFRASVADTLVDVWAEAGKPDLFPYDIKDIKGRCMSHIAPTQEEIDSWDGKSTPRFVKDMVRLNGVALVALTKDIDRLCESQQKSDEDLVGLVLKGERGNNLEATVRFVQRLKDIGTPDWCIIAIVSFEKRMIQTNSFISHMLLFFMDEQAVRMVLGIGVQNASRSTQMFARTLAGCDNELSLKIEKLERAIADSTLSFSETLRSTEERHRQREAELKSEADTSARDRMIAELLIADEASLKYQSLAYSGKPSGEPQYILTHGSRDLIQENLENTADKHRKEYPYLHYPDAAWYRRNVLKEDGTPMDDASLQKIRANASNKRGTRKRRKAR